MVILLNMIESCKLESLKRETEYVRGDVGVREAAQLLPLLTLSKQTEPLTLAKLSPGPFFLSPRSLSIFSSLRQVL